MLARDEDAGHGPPGGSDYPLDVWSSFYRAVNEGLALCGCPGQFFVLPEQMRDEREPE